MALVRFGSWFTATGSSQGSSSNKCEAQVSIYHMPYRLLLHCIFQEMLCYSFNDRILAWMTYGIIHNVRCSCIQLLFCIRTFFKMEFNDSNNELGSMCLLRQPGSPLCFNRAYKNALNGNSSRNLCGSFHYQAHTYKDSCV